MVILLRLPKTSLRIAATCLWMSFVWKKRKVPSLSQGKKLFACGIYVLVTFLLLLSLYLIHTERHPSRILCQVHGTPLCADLDFRWQPLNVAADPLGTRWIDLASARTGKNFSASCKSNCGLNNEQKSIYSSYNESLELAAGRERFALKIYSVEEVCTRMRRYQTILGFGDSHMRRILSSWMADSASVNVFEKETMVPADQIQLEKSQFLPCMHSDDTNITVYKLTAFVAMHHLTTKVKPVLDSFLESGHSIDLLLIGFGIHNVVYGNNHLNFTAFRQIASDTYEIISDHPVARNADIFWILPHMTDVSKLPYPYNLTRREQNVWIRRYNDAIVNFFRGKGYSKWKVVDFYGLTRDKLYNSQDAVHFLPSIFRWKNQVLYSVLFDTCA